ncbi:hypothetical protein [Aquaspirillum soli]
MSVFTFLRKFSKRFSTGHTKFDRYAISFALIILVVVVIFYFANFNHGLSKDNGDWGTFGDFIGGTLNPIFSLLAFLALLRTIRLQSKEMELTREEMELTRDELKRAAEAQEKTQLVLDEQLKITAVQKFEATFFLLLDQHHQMLESISQKQKGGFSQLEITSSSVFEHGDSSLSYQKTILQDDSRLVKYLNFLHLFIVFLNKNIHLIVKIDQSTPEANLTPNNNVYIELIKYSLSSEVLQLLAIYSFDSPEHKALIEKYCLLENIEDQRFELQYFKSEFSQEKKPIDVKKVPLPDTTKEEIEEIYSLSAFKKN